MNWFDAAVLAVIFVYVISGIAKGFGRSAIGFIAFAAAVLCALWFYVPLGFWLRSYIEPKSVGNGVGFLLIFVGVTILGGIAGHFASRFVQAAQLQWLDRPLGGAFGLLQGLVMAAIAVFALTAFSTRPMPAAVLHSRSLPLLEQTAYCVVSVAPPEVKDGFQRARRDLERVLPEHLRKQIDRFGTTTI